MSSIDELLKIVKDGRDLFTPSDADFSQWEPVIQLAEKKGLVIVKRQKSKRRGDHPPVHIQVKIPD